MTDDLHPPSGDVRAAVERALAEDLSPFGDLSGSLIDPGVVAVARFVARRPGVLAGTACADETFRQLGSGIAVEWTSDEGSAVSAGAELGRAEGPLVDLLAAERTALNFLGHLSGVATLTAAYVAAAALGSPHCRVWDTRKTLPGMRSLQKAAVRAGGGWNHRANLSDWVMLKDNHLRGISIADGVAAARRRWPGRTVEVECDRLDQVERALAARADLILLDNMDAAGVARAMAVVEAHRTDTGHRPLVEASGGVDLDTIGGLAAAGVDLVSVGALTHSAPVFDIGLDIGET